MKKAFKIARNLLLAALASLLLISTIIPAVLGFVPLAVLTGSMAPSIKPGDLVVTKPIKTEGEVRVGDVITFFPRSEDPTMITHRVKSIGITGKNGKVFTTQGDANASLDDTISFKQVRGRLVYTVPKVGYLTTAVAPGTKALLIQASGAGLIITGLIKMALAARRTKRAE